MTGWDASRRTILKSAVGAALMALGPRRAWARTSSFVDFPGGCPAIDGLLVHADSAVVVGLEYLSLHPEERDPKHLRHLIDEALGDRLDVLDPAVLRERVRQRLRQDFAESRTAIVHGWILSVTESRICALAALLRA